MSNSKIQQIRDDLKTLLPLNVASVDSVYDFPTDTFDGYPAVVINSAGWDNSFNDTSRNRVTYKFELYLIQAVTGTTDEQTARKRIDAVSDDLLDYFNTQVHFSGSIKTEPMKGEAPILIERPNPVIMAKMIIQLMYLIPR